MYTCKCHHLPEEGKFTIGKTYEWTYLIDGIQVTDDNGNEISWDEYTFLWYFSKIKEEK